MIKIGGPEQCQSYAVLRLNSGHKHAMLERHGGDFLLVPTEGAGVALYQIGEETLTHLHRRVRAEELISELSAILKPLRKTEEYLVINHRCKAALWKLLSSEDFDLAHRLFLGFRFENALDGYHLGWLEASQVRMFSNSLGAHDLDAIVNGPRKEEILEDMMLFAGASFEQRVQEVKKSYQLLGKFFDQASAAGRAILITDGLADSMPSLKSRTRLQREGISPLLQTTIYAIEDELVSSLIEGSTGRLQDQVQGGIEKLKTVRRIQRDSSIPRFSISSEVTWTLGFIAVIGGQTLRVPGIFKIHAVASGKLRSLAESIKGLREPLRSHLGGLSLMAEKHQKEGLSLTETEQRIKTLASFYTKAASNGRALLVLSETIDASQG